MSHDEREVNDDAHSQDTSVIFLAFATMLKHALVRITGYVCRRKGAAIVYLYTTIAVGVDAPINTIFCAIG